MNKKLMSVTIATFLFLSVIITTVPISRAVTWSTDIRLTTDSSIDWDPAITQTSDGRIWVAWASDRTGKDDIFYKIWSDSSWSDDIQLTYDTHLDRFPSILQTNDGKIWIVWSSDRTGNIDLFYKTSSDNGVSWSSDTQLTTDPSRDDYPSIMQASDGKVLVFWTSGRLPTPLPPDYEPQYADIYFKVSSDSGQTWSEDTHVVTDYKNNYRDDLYPSCMQAVNGSIWMVWAKEAKDIYYKIYNGTAWSWEVQLTFDSNENTNPFIMQTANERIWVFWDSFINQNDENVYYKVFDGSWSNDVQLTTAMEDDQWPSAMQAEDLTIWVAWTSPRYPSPSPWDIFYRTGMELHDVAVRSVTPYTSHSTFAYRGEVVYIEVEVENQGEGKENFEVKCYVNSILVGSRIVTLDSGKSFVLVFEWNTANVKPGIYIPSGTAVAVQGETDTSDNSLAGSSFEVRIKGDICGWYDGVLRPIPDRCVNIDDVGMVVGHFWTASPTWHPVWGPTCDITEDGWVDLRDVNEVVDHYGET